jgi:hypothetical protein
MSNSRDAGADSARGRGDEDLTGHLSDVEDGAGCTEIWETLSEYREEAAAGDD